MNIKEILLNIKKYFFEKEPEHYSNCLYCGKPLIGNQRKFCSLSCCNAFHRKKRKGNVVINYKPISQEQRIIEEKKYKVRKIAYRLYPSLKGIKCEICGKKAEHRHHEDYDKPKDVNFLCWSCHGKVHAGKIKVNSSKERNSLKGGKK